MLTKSRHQPLQLNESKPPTHTHTFHSVLAVPHAGFAYYGIWTKVWTGRSGVRSLQDQDISLFSKTSRTALAPTEPPAQWVPVFFPRRKATGGVKLTSHLLLVLTLGMSGAIHFILYVFITQTGTSLLLRGCTNLTAQVDSTSYPGEMEGTLE